MKVLKMKVDNAFLSNEKQPKPVFRLTPVTAGVRDVDSIVPFEKHGKPWFIVTMKRGTVYHARYDIEIVRK